MYEKILRADGLDPNRMKRDQRCATCARDTNTGNADVREYSLPGSYRRMIRQPKNVAWRAIRYTDPEVALTQSDEDKILGQNPPAEDDPEGKFTAVQVEFELAASVYATMALREVTREETSTWHHAGLTLSGEDQEFRGSNKKEEEGEEVVVGADDKHEESVQETKADKEGAETLDAEDVKVDEKVDDEEAEMNA